MLKIVAIVSFVCVLFIRNAESAPTALQILPEREGYIPVYIRNGDTPLIDINLELAEAFRETNNVQTRVAKAEEEKPVADQAAPEKKHNDEPEAETTIAPPKAKRDAEDEPSESAKTSSNEENTKNEEQHPSKQSAEESPENARKRRDPEDETKLPATEDATTQEKLENKSDESESQTPSQVEQKDEKRPKNDEPL